MSSNLKVNSIVPATGSNVAIGTAGGTITYNASVSGVSTFTSVSATSIVGVATAGITTAYIGSVNDGPISGARNRIINGDMRIDQRNGGASVTANAGTAFSCDRWRSYLNGTGTLTFTQSSVVPNGNFTNSILITVTGTGSPTESACSQTIEGFNISDFGFGTANAIPLTASFWVRSSVTGTYFFSLRQGSGSRSFVSPFTISTANTWQQVTVSIPGDTSGTYNTTNGAGFIFQICVGATSLQTSTINAWQSGNYVCTSAQTNLASTNGATFYITGVQLEPGTVATPFERRSYSQELSLCYRYCFVEDNNDGAGGYGSYRWFAYGHTDNTAGATVGRALPVTMRTAPSGTISNQTHFISDRGQGATTLTALAVSSFTTPTFVRLGLTAPSSSYSVGQPAALASDGTLSRRYIIYSAEL
jgi:hypothetical protein